MGKSNYVVNYNLFLSTHAEYRKEIIVKNKLNVLDATTSLEAYLKRKYGDKFVRMEVTKTFEDKFGLWGMTRGFGKGF